MRHENPAIHAEFSWRNCAHRFARSRASRASFEVIFTIGSRPDVMLLQTPGKARTF
jgi:hypothetical protein